jgi:DNA-binding transcriptional LysR family regulator
MLPQLIAFEACLRLGGVTRAAEELCLAQPTVSGLLKRLSDTIGEPVLVARNGRMHPTRAGREVAALCDDIFASFERYEARRGDREPSRSPARFTPESSGGRPRTG